MALKFNPFTGTLDYTVSGEVEEKAKGVPTGGATSTVLMKKSATNYDDEWKLVADANVAASAAIAESKLSLPEVVIKTTEQTITGTKKFAPPTLAETAEAAGASGTVAVEVASGGGQTAAGTGGNGAGLVINTGAGGNAKNTTKANATGGSSGSIEIKTGVAGSGISNEAAENLGGNGGTIIVEAGTGGSATGTGAGARRGSPGGELRFTAGAGGSATTGTGERVGGAGGGVVFEAASGGAVSAGGTAAGAGGPISFLAGKSGGSIGSPLGGAISFQAGVGTTDALSGAVELKTGKSSLVRFTINGEGLTTVKSGLTVEGAAKLEGAVTAAKTVKVKELLTAEKGATVEGVVLKSAVTPERKAFNVAEGTVEVGVAAVARRVVVSYTAKKEAKVKVKHLLNSESLNITALTFTSATKLYVPFAIKEWKVLTAEEVEITWSAEPAAKAEILILIDG